MIYLTNVLLICAYATYIYDIEERKVLCSSREILNTKVWIVYCVATPVEKHEPLQKDSHFTVHWKLTACNYRATHCKKSVFCDFQESFKVSFQKCKPTRTHMTWQSILNLKYMKRIVVCHTVVVFQLTKFLFKDSFTKMTSRLLWNAGYFIITIEVAFQKHIQWYHTMPIYKQKN